MLLVGEKRPLEALLRRIPTPQSDAELEIASRYYFGVPLHLSKLNLYDYQVAEPLDSYDPFGRDYDAHSVFWYWAIGSLRCGGVATYSYGQFRCGHRQRRRLERWICSRRKGDSSSVREAFAKVSRSEDGTGVNTLNRCRGVL